MTRIQNMTWAAIQQAKKAVDHRYKHGAVIFEGSNILSAAFNKKKYSAALRKYGYKRCYLHAESHAILKIPIYVPLNRATLVAVRVCKTKLGNSKPCPHCMAMIRERGIHSVIYSNASGEMITLKV